MDRSLQTRFTGSVHRPQPTGRAGMGKSNESKDGIWTAHHRDTPAHRRQAPRGQWLNLRSSWRTRQTVRTHTNKIASTTQPTCKGASSTTRRSSLRQARTHRSADAPGGRPKLPKSGDGTVSNTCTCTRFWDSMRWLCVPSTFHRKKRYSTWFRSTPPWSTTADVARPGLIKSTKQHRYQADPNSPYHFGFGQGSCMVKKPKQPAAIANPMHFVFGQGSTHRTHNPNTQRAETLFTYANHSRRLKPEEHGLTSSLFTDQSLGRVLSIMGD